MKKNIIIAFIAFLVGVAVCFYMTFDNHLGLYGCNSVARFHHDIMREKYGIGTSTDTRNPQRNINQQASNLNSLLLAICQADPRTTDPCMSFDTHLKQACLQRK